MNKGVNCPDGKRVKENDKESKRYTTTKNRADAYINCCTTCFQCKDISLMRDKLPKCYFSMNCKNCVR